MELIETASLRFAPSNARIETRSFDKYTTVVGDASSKWRIDGTQPLAMHLTATAAIHYVTQKRAETTDPIIQKNADLTLKKLVPYR